MTGSRSEHAEVGRLPASELVSALGILMFSYRQWVRANLPEDDGMTAPRATVLLALANKSDMVSMSTLGEINGMSPRSMTVLIDGLEREGLVARFAHPTDRRVTLVGITEVGTRFVTHRLGPSQVETARLFDALEEEEQVALLSLTQKLLDDLKKRGIQVPRAR